MTGLRFLQALVVAALAAMLTPAPGSSQSTAATGSQQVESAGCKSRTLIDFTRPLKMLPKTRETPKEGGLPLPFSEMVFSRESKELLASGQPIEYSLLSLQYPPPPPKLLIKSKLVRINRLGKVLRTVKQTSEWVLLSRTLPSEAVGFARSPRPGLYRYDLAIWRGSRLVATYQDYYRVAKRSTKVRLRLNGEVFKAGDEIVGQIENYTAEPASYDLRYWVQRFELGEWSPVSLNNLFGRLPIFIGPSQVADPGLADRCFEILTVPEAMGPGRYRLIKIINGRLKRLKDDPRRITTELKIEP
jgi:hypothetical protein